MRWIRGDHCFYERVVTEYLEGGLGNYLADVSSDDEVRQGDLIRRFSEAFPEGEWGFVLTADCDIAQGKAGDRYSFVEVVPGGTYLEDVWAPAQLKRFLNRQAKTAAEQLTAVMKQSGLDLGITADVLLAWLDKKTPNEVGIAVNRTGKPLDQKLAVLLGALRVALGRGDETTAMDRLRGARALMGEDPKRIRRSICEAFEAERGFPDFFMLPELPEATGFGFVVMLRAIRSLHAGDLFTTEVEARIAGRPDAFHRIGRLTDGVRFAITQKLAFLFSRIGLPRHYEEACQLAVEMLSETLVIE